MYFFTVISLLLYQVHWPSPRPHYIECRNNCIIVTIILVISLAAAIIWLIGSILNCICPCCISCTAIVNLAMSLVKLPVEIVIWFIDKIPY
ncbi:hypothetical protein AQUCO_00300248v1 [Aquilegia coerulea]|uniref:Uncharacterized protein n=1 Tax=Aquilegia coerulea TaxID=218851 RepID=A0A2G5CV92_AQUCA|nr:hypothetical protein AQUCO_03600080v1 [Aquilegia coerulea]PIA60614.1 hypothetical protein AQUCO_00300248v1 [Aquilegia coerulea]